MNIDSLFIQNALDSGVEDNFDFTKPFLKVTAYKDSGKWYATKFTNIDDDLLQIIESNNGFLIIDMIIKSDDSMSQYCPLNSWCSGMFFQVESYGTNGFCNYLIRK